MNWLKAIRIGWEVYQTLKASGVDFKQPVSDIVKGVKAALTTAKVVKEVVKTKQGQ